jgi:hypothetical protein
MALGPRREVDVLLGLLDAAVPRGAVLGVAQPAMHERDVVLAHG